MLTSMYQARLPTACASFPTSTARRVARAHKALCKPCALHTTPHAIRQLQLARPVRLQPAHAAAGAAIPYDDSDYSPAEVATGNSSFSQAVFNVLNVIMGVGILSLPFAFRQSGWAGLGILWLLGFVCNYTAKALVDCHNVVSERPEHQGKKVGYEEVAEAAFGGMGKLVVSSAIYIELFGTCCLLFILEGDNLFNLLGANSLAASPTAYMLLAALAIIPTQWLPDLRALSFLGVCGISATAAVVLTVLYTLLTGSFAPGAVTELACPATAPLVFGIMAFVYSGHGVFPSIRASMKEPERFPQVLNVAYIVVGSMCTFIGCAGYYMYGKGALDVINFNLPPGILATLCSCLILINPVAKFAVTLEPVSSATTHVIAGTPTPPVHVRLFARTLAAVACLTAARFLPFLAPLMSLIGSFLTIGVSIIFPALIHLKLHPGAPALRVATNAAVVAIGVVCATAGTTASIRRLAAAAAAASAGAC